MYKIGDICPLFFNGRDYKYDNVLTYRQRFHSSDKILVEVFSTETAPVFTLYDLIENTYRNIRPSTYSVNDNISLYYVEITGLDSVFQLGITVDGEEKKSSVFEMCSSSEILDTTSLISYYHSSNNTPFDEIFWAGDVPLVHQFRVEAGFKSAGFTTKVDAESFRTQKHENRLMYAASYIVETLTIGGASGVPVCFAGLINSIFCLDRVNLDGEKIVRNDASEVSKTAVMEGSQQYVLTLDIERVSTEIEGIGGLKQSGSVPAVVTNGVPVVLSDTIEDGSLLQYRSDMSSFVDTNNPR